MKKSIIICLLFLGAYSITNAQSTTAQVEYNKVSQAGIVNELPFDPGITEDAIVNKMKSLGYSGKSSKGFIVFKAVKLAELGADTYDMYYKIERKSKKEKDKSTVSLLLTKGYENFANETSDPALFANAKTFLNGLTEVVAAADLERQIEEQEAVAKKAQKKYNNSVDDGADLEKKKRQIEQDIADNIKDQANKKAEAATQQQILETLKAKRKN
ncbi:hypothetical protein ACQ33O_05125 [Ferruginibacter sp. SUN002]|uniref:hypothetical protein n=1 Tax=Ferruginibacter sp. SUN002 TaxID=2937789 RepID=UPI003D35D6EB